MDTFISDVSHAEFPISTRILAGTVRTSVFQLIQSEHPDITANSYLSMEELNGYRGKYIANYLSREMGELSGLETQVLESIEGETSLAEALGTAGRSKENFAQRCSDRIAEFGGSWKFIIYLLVYIVVWVGINVFWLANKSFDPYPFILLNLVLCFLGAVQAPIILMSQNRMAEKDRARAVQDYMLNLKAELEVRIINEKIDHHVQTQQQDLIALQEQQVELLKQIKRNVNRAQSSNL